MGERTVEINRIVFEPPSWISADEGPPLIAVHLSNRAVTYTDKDISGSEGIALVEPERV